jgi:photosystem II stability/assembly factor-like uncharacterized protein
MSSARCLFYSFLTVYCSLLAVPSIMETGFPPDLLPDLESLLSLIDLPLRPLFRLCVALTAVLPSVAIAQTGPSNAWRSIGPWGGDARSFASVPGDPQHLYLGGIDNWVFESKDGGQNWVRKGRIGPGDDPGDLIVDSLLVDAGDKHTLFAGVHRSYNAEGGLYRSSNGGVTWTVIPALKDQSVRSVAQAPSDPNILVVGTLEGIFRSQDHGESWERISPAPPDPLSREIHEVESLAIDPRKPDTIYAGTWHLPWKTTDGGVHWRNIKQGVIDDSDVFSIIIDPERSSIVYASACSGIYKSEDSGLLFHKIQGIPSTARRTRVLMQDTRHREIVYAGTTEGLYRTRDGGHEWQRLTDANVIVNDIYIDPSHAGRVLIATDRGGVLVSNDNGLTFAQSNDGFSARKVEALVADSRNPQRILAGIVNDKSYGGAFLTTDAGQSWSQIAEGLDGRDVFTFAQAKDGTILAGTNHGIFALETGENFSHPHWTMRSTIVNTGSRIVNETVNGHKISRYETIKIPARALSARIYDFDLTTDIWAAATAEGVFTSKDKGETWQGGLVLGSAEYRSIASYKGEILVARRTGAAFSRDGGLSWDPVGLPSRIKDIRTVAFSKEGELWVGAGDGVYFSRDFSQNGGKSWFWLEKIPARDVGDLAFDPATGHMLVTSRSSPMLYSIDPVTLAHTGMQTGYRLFMARVAGNARFAASLQDGVLTDPEPLKASAAPSSPAIAEKGPAANPNVHPALQQQQK